MSPTEQALREFVLRLLDAFQNISAHLPHDAKLRKFEQEAMRVYLEIRREMQDE